MILKLEDKLLLLSAKIQLTSTDEFEFKSIISKDIRWDTILITAIERGLAPLLYYHLTKYNLQKQVPEIIYAKLKSTYHKTLSRSILMQEAFNSIASEFNKSEIQFIPLKGVLLSEWLYKDIGLRQFSDIDILVKPSVATQALEILNKLGYKTFDDIDSEQVGGQADFVHYKARVLNNISVEIHTRLHGSDVEYELNLNDIWLNSEEYAIRNIPFRVLDLHNLIIFLCLHLDKHFYVGHVQFTSFCDIVNLLSLKKEFINFDTLESLSEKYNCPHIIFKYILMCEFFFKTEIPFEYHTKYKHLLTESSKYSFITYLNGIKPTTTQVIRRFKRIKYEKNFLDKFFYLKRQILPSKSEMIVKYSIRNSNFYFLFYFLRLFKGLKGMFLLLFNKNKTLH